MKKKAVTQKAAKPNVATILAALALRVGDLEREMAAALELRLLIANFNRALADERAELIAYPPRWSRWSGKWIVSERTVAARARVAKAGEAMNAWVEADAKGRNGGKWLKKFAFPGVSVTKVGGTSQSETVPVEFA